MYNFCMDTQHHTLRCAAYAFVIKEHKILLILRKNTGWMDGKYGLPAGHLEKDETIKDALIREVQEEIGLKIRSTDLTFYHVMHRHEKAIGNFEYIDFFFKLEYWQEEPINNEPEKAEHIKWFDLDSLPENIIPNVEAAIKNYRGKLVFSEFS